MIARSRNLTQVIIQNCIADFEGAQGVSTRLCLLESKKGVGCT
jgi:hypothetical protein